VTLQTTPPLRLQALPRPASATTPPNTTSRWPCKSPPPSPSTT
jgi:hypothetical protein